MGFVYMIFVYGVEIYFSGVLVNVENFIFYYGGYFWFKDGGYILSELNS